MIDKQYLEHINKIFVRYFSDIYQLNDPPNKSFKINISAAFFSNKLVKKFLTTFSQPIKIGYEKVVRNTAMEIKNRIYSADKKGIV